MGTAQDGTGQAGDGPQDGAAALEALRCTWDDAYEIGHGDRGWWARRRDWLGGEILADGPDALGRGIAEDHAFRPVVLGAAAQPGGAS